MALVEVQVPDIGDFDEVGVIEVLVKVGDTVKVEQSLVTVESDKASMEIPSSQAGVVKEIKVAVGDKVKQGSVLVVVEGEAAGAPAAPAAALAPAAAAPAAAAPAPAAAAPAPEPAQSSGSLTIDVPDIGDFDEVAVIEVLVKAGDTVKVEQSLITVESDKASMEIPSSTAGVVEELLVKVGDKVKKGSPLARVKAAGGAAPAAAPAAAAPAAAPAQASAPAAAAPADAKAVPTAALPPHQPVAPTGQLPHASPSIRKLARELGVPLDEVKGSGAKGRIVESDVQGFVKAVMSGSVQTAAQKAAAPQGAAGGGGGLSVLAWPKVDFEKFGAVERKELSRIKKISGANLHRNWVVIPHVTNHDDADITELEAFRVQLNLENEKAAKSGNGAGAVKVTMLAFMIKAAVAALKKFPEFNSSLDGDTLVLKQYFHIGFAADTPNGLVVPVIKDADKKGIFQITQEMGELAKKARDGKLAPADMSGGCFSISSLGGIGGKYFTPIINAPEVAIMGVCKSSIEPVWDANVNGGAFQPRLILPLSLSWDHRVIDGASAARFNVYFASLLSDFRRIAL
jgi:pyruvate dehydrogenase E2 component (dihydrolipoamide acetyltransferase)